jgi:hypothetical protein
LPQVNFIFKKACDQNELLHYIETEDYKFTKYIGKILTKTQHKETIQCILEYFIICAQEFPKISEVLVLISGIFEKVNENLEEKNPQLIQTTKIFLVQLLQGKKKIEKENLINIKMIGYKIVDNFDIEEEEEVCKCNVAVMVKNITNSK